MRRNFAHKAEPRDPQSRFLRRPAKPVRVINTLDPEAVSGFMASPESDRMILNLIRRNGPPFPPTGELV